VTSSGLPYADLDLDLDQLLAVITNRLAIVAGRLHLGPVPEELSLIQAAALLVEYAEEQIHGHLADAHRQLGYAASELRTAANLMDRGDDGAASVFARSAAIYLDQAEMRLPKGTPV
jgi:hypothetical protein